jgi:hypothetical protein
VLLVAQLLFALGRFVPGGVRAMQELSFHLERDADRWSLGRRNDRLALASVIAKAAQGRPLAAGVTLMPLAAAGALERIRQLVDGGGPVRPRSATALRTLAVGMVTVTVALGALLPVSVVASVQQLPSVSVRHCSG